MLGHVFAENASRVTLSSFREREERAHSEKWPFSTQIERFSVNFTLSIVATVEI